MLRVAKCCSKNSCYKNILRSQKTDAKEIVDKPFRETGPGGTWWRVTVKEAPRYMWSAYATRPHPRGIDIDYQKEHENRTPSFTKHLDDIPDEINPSKVQPFLEYRNTALGNAGYNGTNEDMHELYWRPLMNHRNWNLDKLKEEDDMQWRQYKERNGIYADEYMLSDTYARRYGGKADEFDAYIWSQNNYRKVRINYFEKIIRLFKNTFFYLFSISDDFLANNPDGKQNSHAGTTTLTNFTI